MCGRLWRLRTRPDLGRSDGNGWALASRARGVFASRAAAAAASDSRHSLDGRACLRRGFSQGRRGSAGPCRYKGVVLPAQDSMIESRAGVVEGSGLVVA